MLIRDRGIKVRAPRGASAPAGVRGKEYGSDMTPMGKKVYYGTPSDYNIYEVEVEW